MQTHQNTTPADDKWNKRFLEMALMVSNWSKDPSTRHGAVIVDAKRRVVSLGYNGLPRGVEDTEQRLHNREIKYAITAHCEENAIISAERSLDGCTIYLTGTSCSHCSALLIQAGIKRVVYWAQNQSYESRWEEKNKLALQILKEAAVEVVRYE